MRLCAGEVRQLTELGVAVPPKIRAAAAEGERYYRFGVLLKKVATRGLLSARTRRVATTAHVQVFQQHGRTHPKNAAANAPKRPRCL